MRPQICEFTDKSVILSCRSGHVLILSAILILKSGFHTPRSGVHTGVEKPANMAKPSSKSRESGEAQVKISRIRQIRKNPVQILVNPAVPEHSGSLAPMVTIENLLFKSEYDLIQCFQLEMTKTEENFPKPGSRGPLRLLYRFKGQQILRFFREQN